MLPSIYTKLRNASGFASGRYTAELRAGMEAKTVKLFLLK